METASSRQSAAVAVLFVALLTSTGWAGIAGHAMPTAGPAPAEGVAKPAIARALPGPPLRLVQAVGGAKAGTPVGKAAEPAPPTTTPPVPVVDVVGGLQETAVIEPPSVQQYLPYGKGMWIYQPAKTEGANAAAIVARAKAVGLSHLYVRMGSAWDGFNVAPFIDQLLPAAHAAGIQVFGWDFPKLDPWLTDLARAQTMIVHTAPGGHRIDGFAADIETRSEGTHITPEAAAAYGKALRESVGPVYPLVVAVPRPSPARAGFPYAEVVSSFDAIAPMVYWLNRQPDTDVAGALTDLARFGKPILPVGQAYDGAPEGGRKGVPPREELLRFTRTAAAYGAVGVSFWSWQAADQQAWDAIRDAEQFRVGTLAAAVLRARGNA